MTLNNQIVGMIRFSYLAQSGGWDIKKPMGQHKKQLYSAERMDLRFRLFENLTVPSMTYQTDQDFKCIVLCSSEMPEAHQERLLDIIEGHENLVCLALPPMPHHVAILEAFEMIKDDSYEYFTSFRLDDDDMLQKTYIETLKNKIEMSKGLIDPHTPLVTAFNFGLFLEKSAQGNRIYDVTERTPGAQGTAMTTHMTDTRTIFSRNHRKLPAFFKTVSHIDTPVWLRTVHSNNIANPKITGRHHLVEESRIAELLDLHFDLTVDQVTALAL